jgi:hypothetical protein
MFSCALIILSVSDTSGTITPEVVAVVVAEESEPDILKYP